MHLFQRGDGYGPAVEGAWWQWGAYILVSGTIKLFSHNDRFQVRHTVPLHGMPPFLHPLTRSSRTRFLHAHIHEHLCSISILREHLKAKQYSSLHFIFFFFPFHPFFTIFFCFPSRLYIPSFTPSLSRKPRCWRASPSLARSRLHHQERERGKARPFRRRRHRPRKVRLNRTTASSGARNSFQCSCRKGR